jgi:hypothetical protein
VSPAVIISLLLFFPAGNLLEYMMEATN